jgi:hypothetical protein
MNAIEIYKDKDNQTQIEVKFDDNTLWLNQKQIAEVFGTEVPAINKHIKNIVNEKELEHGATISKMEIVQHEGGRKVKRTVEFYALDMIISVGYRINSGKATQFRIWATQRLKDYLVKGYAINEQKLKTSQAQLNTLKQSIQLLENVVRNKQLSSDEAIGLLKVVAEYAQALDLLDQYNHQRLGIPETKKEKLHKITYKEAMEQIQLWRDKQKAGKLFGNEKDQSFHSSLGTIYQTFNGKDLYPGINEKAANLLYFIVKKPLLYRWQQTHSSRVVRLFFRQAPKTLP